MKSPEPGSSVDDDAGLLEGLLFLTSLGFLEPVPFGAVLKCQLVNIEEGDAYLLLRPVRPEPDAITGDQGDYQGAAP